MYDNLTVWKHAIIKKLEFPETNKNIDFLKDKLILFIDLINDNSKI